VSASLWNSIWPDLIKGAPAAFVAFVIGCIAARIAYNQYLVSKAKLNLDLFGQRFPIFQKTWQIVSDVGIKGKVEQMSGLATPFNNFRPQARFLFGKEIEKYLNLISSKYIDLEAAATETNALQGQERTDNIAECRDLKDWFYKQATHGLQEKFAPYLDFEKWK
jgi:hypothetical protein